MTIEEVTPSAEKLSVEELSAELEHLKKEYQLIAREFLIASNAKGYFFSNLDIWGFLTTFFPGEQHDQKVELSEELTVKREEYLSLRSKTQELQKKIEQHILETLGTKRLEERETDAAKQLRYHQALIDLYTITANSYPQDDNQKIVANNARNVVAASRAAIESLHGQPLTETVDVIDPPPLEVREKYETEHSLHVDLDETVTEIESDLIESGVIEVGTHFTPENLEEARNQSIAKAKEKMDGANPEEKALLEKAIAKLEKPQNLFFDINLGIDRKTAILLFVFGVTAALIASNLAFSSIAGFQVAISQLSPDSIRFAADIASKADNTRIAGALMQVALLGINYAAATLSQKKRQVVSAIRKANQISGAQSS